MEESSNRLATWAAAVMATAIRVLCLAALSLALAASLARMVTP